MARTVNDKRRDLDALLDDLSSVLQCDWSAFQPSTRSQALRLVRDMQGDIEEAVESMMADLQSHVQRDLDDAFPSTPAE